MRKKIKLILEELINIGMLLGDIRQLLVKERERYKEKDKEKKS